MAKTQVKKAPVQAAKPEDKPVVIRKIVTTIEQDKNGVQKRTTTTYNAPKKKPVVKTTVKKPAAKPAAKKAAPKAAPKKAAGKGKR